ncbi:hypothetical protein V2G26_019782 [Clonostachys chloroleuca]
MEGRTDPRPSRSSRHSEQRSPESQGHSRDSRRGGRPSWRERHPLGPYQRPPRAGSAQSGLATSWAANQDDEAVIVTASNSDAAAPAGAPNPLASAMTDLRLDAAPSASNTNVPHQNPSDNSDHNDLNQGQGTQSYREDTAVWVLYADATQPHPPIDLTTLLAGGSNQSQPAQYQYGIVRYRYRDTSSTPRHSGSHQPHRSNTLVHDFGYPAGNTQRHPEADDRRDA